MADGLSLVDQAVAQILTGTAAPTRPIPYNVWSNAHVARLNVKTGPGYLYGFTAYSSNVAAQFVLVFDSSTAPASGAVACAVFKVSAAANVAANWIPPRAFEAGIWICNSSTEPTLTAGSADCSFDAQYV